MELVQHLFTIPGVKSFLSERIQQDPLEKYFGGQRRGRLPTVAQFLKNDQALRIINSINLDVVSGNTRGTNKRYLEHQQGSGPLNKRRKLKYTGIKKW